LSELTDVASWLFGDMSDDMGFWYSYPLWEVYGLTEEQLYWIPDPSFLCNLFHVGHIAHRERCHVGMNLQGLEPSIIPPEYEVFGTKWASPEDIRRSIGSVDAVFEWVQEVREESRRYIESLSPEDYSEVPPTSEFDLTVSHWLFINVAHTALHVGKLQLLRSLIEGKRERPC